MHIIKTRFAAVVEKEIITMLGVLSSWGWSCLAIKLANLARTTSDSGATVTEVFSGQFLEAAVGIILTRPFLNFTEAVIQL